MVVIHEVAFFVKDIFAGYKGFKSMDIKNAVRMPNIYLTQVSERVAKDESVAITRLIIVVPSSLVVGAARAIGQLSRANTLGGLERDHYERGRAAVPREFGVQKQCGVVRPLGNPSRLRPGQ